jgi:hypothetical protein
MGEMTVLTAFVWNNGVARNFFRPFYHILVQQIHALLHTLLMAFMTCHVVMRTFRPLFPCRFHYVARSAKSRVILNVIICPVDTHPYYDEENNYERYQHFR